VLLAQLLGRERAWIVTHPGAGLDDHQASSLESALIRLASGEPLPYILGRWEFYGMALTITPDVLIPRPETELLVDQAVVWLKAHPDRRKALDVGTGSGCIAVALASTIPDLRLIASDLSQLALRVAWENIHDYNLEERIQLQEADLLDGVEPGDQFDLIVANLPYIPSQTLINLPVHHWEPENALDGGADGLDLIRKLLYQAPSRLAPGGLILMEIEYRQGQAALSLAESAFPFAQVSLLPDLAGHDRLLRVQG
jgi:release factor glutamine methyltransferase